MILRTIVAILGVAQLLAPRRVARFWLARCCRNPEDVELRRWVIAAVRLEGLLMIGWVLWQSREQLSEATDSDGLPGPDFGTEPAADEAAEGPGETPADEPAAPDADATAESDGPGDEGTSAEDAAAAPAEDEDASEAGDPEPSPTLTPGTRRFELASVLYHASEPLRVADFVELSEGTDWDVGRSPASTTLYRMYNDDAVDREEGSDGSYEYWLTDAGRAALDAAEAAIEPNPFAEDDE